MTRNKKHDKRFKSNKIVRMSDWRAEEMKSHIDKTKLEENLLYSDFTKDRRKEFSIKSREKDELICLQKEIEELKIENELLTKVIIYLSRKIS